jgi:hypothetical protein
MNAHDSKRLEQLETATAADLPPGVPLDAETESLRESWLELGQLLEAAAEPVDAGAVIRRCRDLQPLTLPARRSAARTRIAAALLAAGAVVAASLLAVCFLPSMWAPVESIADDEAPAVIPPAEELVRREPASASRHANEQHDPSNNVENADSSATPAWNDAFDAQLARADEQLETLAHTWRSDETRYYTFEQQVRELEAELSGTSL